MKMMYGIEIGEGTSLVPNLINILFSNICYQTNLTEPNTWLSIDKHHFIDQLNNSLKHECSFPYDTYRLRLEYYTDIKCGITTNYDGYFYIEQKENVCEQIIRTHRHRWICDYTDDYLTRIDGFPVIVVDKPEHSPHGIICLNVQYSRIYDDDVVSIKTIDVENLMYLKKRLVYAMRISSDIITTEHIDII
jgi:hypothetical protein